MNVNWIAYSLLDCELHEDRDQTRSALLTAVSTVPRTWWLHIVRIWTVLAG